MSEKLQSATAPTARVTRHGFASYLPDYATSAVYRLPSLDRRRAERLEDEVVAMAEQFDPNAPDPRVELSYRIGTNAMDLPFNNVMYIGPELLHQLNDADCRAVIAHELGHANQKVRVAAIPMVKVACTVLLPAAAIVAGVVTGFGLLTIPAAAAIVVAGHYMGKVAARSAEKHADIFAGKITGRPADLAHALATILPGEAAAPEGFIRRVAVRSRELSMDHPATWRRIQYLEKMQRKMDRRAGIASLAAA